MCLTSCEGTLDDVLGEWSRPSEPAYSVSSLTLDKDSIVLALAGGETTAKLTATIVGNPGTEAVSFLSSDDTKATVDFTSGEVTAVGGGWVKIYATIGEFIDSCSVMVFNQIHDISTGDAAIPANEYWLISGTTTANKITIGEGSSAYLKDVKITPTTGSCIETKNTGSGSNIILVDGTTNTMNGAAKCAAIDTKGGQLTIYGQTEGTGKLIATGGAGGAGIGGSLDGNYSSIVIMGGVIEANGGAYAAGIGSGNCSTSTGNPITSGDITISGGTVTAKGDVNAAGIGTGFGEGTDPASCGIITIETGVVSVTATKGTGATDPIGYGSGTLAHQSIIFGTDKMFNGSSWIISPTAGPHGGLTLAISGNTWTLMPTN